LKRVSAAPSGMPALVTSFGSVYLDLSSGVDIAAEKNRLSKELASLEKVIYSIENKLGNSAFADKAPAQVVEGARRQLAENLAKIKETEEALKALS